MNTLCPEDFEARLDHVVAELTDDLRDGQSFHDPALFQQQVRSRLRSAFRDDLINLLDGTHPHAFPDITLNGYGVEVKFTKKDTWMSVGNSVFEGMRTPGVNLIYVIFGKAGGDPEARWGRYEECVTHVRVSHAPRFVIEMNADKDSLFDNLEVTYDEFSALDDERKMEHVRRYSRQRMNEGERLWWLEEQHSLPMQVRLYMRLPQAEKRMLRAEAALLCPQVCRGSRAKGKYNDAALYLLTHHGVFCPQTRDLFSAGSVAGSMRGGNYLLRALQDIEDLMRDAARRLDGSLFVEYWGEDCDVCDRIAEWLRRADEFAQDWTPSEHLFRDQSS